MLRQSGDGTAAVGVMSSCPVVDIRPGEIYEVLLEKQNGSLGLNVTVYTAIREINCTLI